MSIAKTIVPTGEYYLQGVMETASGFMINEDGSFQFFFSQGALDRFGQGEWTVKDANLILNSRPRPLRDFVLNQSGADEQGGIRISLKGSNSFFAEYTYVKISGAGKIQEGTLNRDSTILFSPQLVESIELVFGFCPEKSSVFRISNTMHTHFEFQFEPWIMEYFFTGFELAIGNNELRGKHPLLKGNAFVYRANRQQE